MTAERFYGAFLAADEEALSQVVAADAVWAVAGESALAGEHRGPTGIAELRRQLGALTNGTWRPLRENSFDIAVSEHHAVIIDRFLAERNGRELDSHEAIVVAPPGGGPIQRLFHYVHDPAAHSAFWSQ
jgi:ketosteroid isomerase-like protein